MILERPRYRYFNIVLKRVEVICCSLAMVVKAAKVSHTQAVAIIILDTQRADAITHWRAGDLRSTTKAGDDRR